MRKLTNATRTQTGLGAASGLVAGVVLVVVDALAFGGDDAVGIAAGYLGRDALGVAVDLTVATLIGALYGFASTAWPTTWTFHVAIGVAWGALLWLVVDQILAAAIVGAFEGDAVARLAVLALAYGAPLGLVFRALVHGVRSDRAAAPLGAPVDEDLRGWRGTVRADEPVLAEDAAGRMNSRR